MLIRPKLILFLLSLFCFSAERQPLAQQKLVFDYIGEKVLTDSVGTFYSSPLSEFHLFGDTLFVTSSPAIIAAYNLDSGKQIFIKKMPGRGPFELENLYNLFVSDSSVLLFDYNGKIIVLDRKSLKPLKEFLPKVSRVKGGVGSEDEIILFNESPSISSFILVFDRSEENLKNLKPDQLFENVMFSAFKDGGTFLKDSTNLYFTMPFGKKLYSLSLESLIVDSLELNIPDFHSSPKDKSMEAYFSDPILLQDFFSSNSLITGLFKVGKRFIVETHQLNQGYRKQFSLFDDKFSFLCQTILDDVQLYDGTNEPSIKFSNNDFVYFYREELHRTERDSADKVLRGFAPKCIE